MEMHGWGLFGNDSINWNKEAIKNTVLFIYMEYWLGQKGINNLRKNIQTMNCSHQSPMFVYVCKNIKFVIQGKEKMLD